MPKAMFSKAELNALVAAGLAHEVFEHSEIGVVDITVMREFSPMLASLGVIEKINTPLAPLCEHIRACRDTEPARLQSLDEASLIEPGIAILCPDGETVICDGHHRALRREHDGEETMRFYRWPLSIAEQLARPDMENYRDFGGDWGTPGYLEEVRAARAAKGENHE